MPSRQGTFWSHKPLSFAPPPPKKGLERVKIMLEPTWRLFFKGGGGKSAASREHQVMRRQTIQPNLPMCYLRCSVEKKSWPRDHILQVETLLKKNPAFWFKQLSCQSAILVTLRIWYECSVESFFCKRKSQWLQTHHIRKEIPAEVSSSTSTPRAGTAEVWGHIFGTFVMDGQPTPQKYGVKYGLLKGNQWVFISPYHKGSRLFLAGGTWPGSHTFGGFNLEMNRS